MKRFHSDDSLIQLPAWGSAMAVFAGFLMTLIGYAASNIFCLSDLFEIPFNGRYIPSPFKTVVTDPESLWFAYAIASAVQIGGMLLIASQPYSRHCGVAYIFCPAVAVTFLLFTPLRGIRNALVADAYRAVGAALTAAGFFSLWESSAGTGAPLHPSVASLLWQIGAVAIVAGTLSLRREPQDDLTSSVAAGA